MVKLPHIAEVTCTPMRFLPGDRVLVRVYTTLDRDQKNHLINTVKKWAGREVEVMVIDARMMEIEVENDLMLRPRGGS